jgi:hypothetical protein
MTAIYDAISSASIGWRMRPSEARPHRRQRRRRQRKRVIVRNVLSRARASERDHLYGRPLREDDRDANQC